MFVIIAKVAKDYGNSTAILGIYESRFMAEEAINSIKEDNDEFNLYKNVEDYMVFEPFIIEVESMNTLSVSVNEDKIDYSDE